MQRTNSEYVLHTWPSHVFFTNSLHAHTLQPMPYLMNYKVMSILCAFFILDSFQTQLELKGITHLVHRVKEGDKVQITRPNGFNHWDAQSLGTFKEARNQKKPHLTRRRLLQGPQEEFESIQQCGLEEWPSKRGILSLVEKEWRTWKKGKSHKSFLQGQPLWFKPDGRL